MKLNLRNIFLLDGVGALLSAAGTGILLPFFAEWVGVSASLLRLLGLQAALYAVYSLSCYGFLRKPKPGFLLVIILANLIYGLEALALAVVHPEITALGRAFFVGETIILLGVVWLEIGVLRRAPRAG